MPAISESVTIKANIADVFALISRVEEFPMYARYIEDVQRIGRRTYHWVARVEGVRLTWDSIISEFCRPTRLSWRSIRGFENAGTYTLIQVPGGTRVDLHIEYGLTGGLLGAGIGRLVKPAVGTAAKSILARVKERLEGRRPDTEKPGSGLRRSRRLTLPGTPMAQP